MIIFWFSAAICATVYVLSGLRWLGYLPDTDSGYEILKGALGWALILFVVGLIVVLV